MEQNNVALTAITYEHLLKGMARVGNSRGVKETLETMKNHGVETTLLAYVYAIRCFYQRNDATMALDLMKEAENANLPLQTEPRLLLDVLRVNALNDKVNNQI